MRSPDLTGRPRPIVAIDGPAGAGKSTVASHLARRFGFLNLETGAMYRALALKAIENDIDVDNEAELMALTLRTRITLEPQVDGNRVLLDSIVVSKRIREADVTAAASRVSVHPAVRHWMVEQQRALGKAGGVVMEGRDIGTVVFPQADIKVFLDAAPEIRGDRRFRQTDTATRPESQAAVLQEIRDRDARDRNRAESPLHPAEDATVLDTTDMSLDQVLERVENLVKTAIG